MVRRWRRKVPRISLIWDPLALWYQIPKPIDKALMQLREHKHVRVDRILKVGMFKQGFM